jgi:tRNA nucleotidyltransferase (CCA-adding enzyme)
LIHPIPQATEIIEKLNDAGYLSFLVGGCIRDSIMGAEPKDWDVTTSATPDEIKAVFSEETVAEAGIRYGTVTVIIDGVPIEVTTFRIDGRYEDSRRPSCIEFTGKLSKDLKRRDFTINAIAWHPTLGMIDPLGGQSDIEKEAFSSQRWWGLICEARRNRV